MFISIKFTSYIFTGKKKKKGNGTRDILPYDYKCTYGVDGVRVEEVKKMERSRILGRKF
ncbi:hypothetical protein WN48_10316 [Eufriesea mexicana]|uniref:Uncharacterized protein n=1 Tax=Eufriesea mexicana TaxID=516756 RepID=A0A310SND2_9HYME|nr:hypothetical protein WN48_10316 [Eufriesea mexicana]